MAELEASVVIPSYKAGRKLARCVASVLAQDFEGGFEVIVIASGDLNAPDLDEDPRLILLALKERLSAAEARNLACQRARGRHIVFTDSGVVVPRGWLDALVESGQDGTKVVAGSVRNATPRSLTGTTEYLVEFLDLHPARPPNTAWHGAACNLLIPRELWDRLGPWVDLGGGEDTLLTARAHRDGVFVFAPDAWVWRSNRTGVRTVAGHQAGIGRYSAHLGRMGPYKLRPLVAFSLLAPVAATARLISIYARVLAWGRDAIGVSILAFPIVVLSLVAWGWGLFIEGITLDLRRVRVRFRRPEPNGED